MSVLGFIMDKICEKPDPSSKMAIDFDNKIPAERERQVSVNPIYHCFTPPLKFRGDFGF